jgi:flavin reductase (DIM6/NTAB) family NADH-FMN oxidoreductase RutF
VTGQRFGSIAGSLNPPLVVVTTAAQGERAGCLVGFHSQSSIEPLRYSLWVSKANHTYRVALHATAFAMHFLTVADLELAELFGGRSGDDVDKFAEISWRPGLDDVPLLDALPHRLQLRRVALLDEGGDHVCISAAVEHTDGAEAFEPLRLRAAAHLQPGHDYEERAPV